MEKIIIERVAIHSFKNIQNLSFSLNKGEDFTVTGKNGLGKSNILNAIYWCIMGTDLNGCTEQTQFLPYRNTESKVDVEVQLNIGKIKRVVEVDAKGTASQTVLLDDTIYTLKDYDIELDKRLGLLPFTFNNL